jgi:hypothetical protein
VDMRASLPGGSTLIPVVRTDSGKTTAEQGEMPVEPKGPDGRSHRHGQRDFGVNGSEWTEKVARGRAGSGSVAVVSIGCTAGGVSWPSTLVFYGRDDSGNARLLAHVYLGRIRASEHASVRSMRIKGGVLKVRWVTYNGCCFERQKYSASMRLRGKKVTFWNLTSGRVTHPH